MNWIHKMNEAHNRNQQQHLKRWIDDVETTINEIFSTKCKCALHTTITITAAIDWFLSYGSKYSTRQPCWRRPQKTNRMITVWHSINQNNLFFSYSLFVFSILLVGFRLENIDRYLKISTWYVFLLLLFYFFFVCLFIACFTFVFISILFAV